MTEKTAYKTATIFFSVFSLYAVFLITTLIVKGPLSNMANPISMANAATVTSAAMDDNVASRIAPVGQTKMKGDEPKMAKPAMAVVDAAPAVAVAGKSGEDVYNTSCAACHGTGILGAPKTGDDAAWKARMTNGMEGLVSNAINGKGAMPPRGGNAALSDAEILAAIEFMQ